MKSVGMPKKTIVPNFNAIDDNKSLTYEIKTMSNVFKDFFSNLAKSSLDKLPDPSNKYNLESVFLYDSNFAIPELFHIKSTSEEKDFKIMENIEISKASGIAKLKPIFKKSKKVHPSNYRPISLLPLISKIIEKVVHDQTDEFLSIDKILYNHQSRFRTNHSTNLCLS